MELPTEAEPVKVIEGDCLEVLRGLPDGSVDAVICDPPYPCIDRPYGYWTEAEWFALMDPVVEQCRRVLNPSGSAVFVLQPNSEQAGRMRPWLWRFMADWSERWGMVQDAWWWNTCAMPSGAATTCGLLRPSLKACVWLGPADCYRDQLSVLWPESAQNRYRRDRGESGAKKFPSGATVDRRRAATASVNRGGVTPMNVYPCGNDGYAKSLPAGALKHSAATPMSLVRWWARYICPPGGLVLDPFGGSGTTGVAALAEARRCLLIEKEPTYAAIARKRVAEAMGTGSLFAGATP